MKYVFFLAVIFGVQAARADVNCSDSSSSVHYEEIGYNKGIPPRPGDLIRTVRVKIKAELKSESKYYEQQSPDLGPIASELEQVKVIFEAVSNTSMVRVYSAKLTLKNRKSAPYLIFSDFVICKEVVNFVP